MIDDQDTLTENTLPEDTVPELQGPVHSAVFARQSELAVVAKRTYKFGRDGTCVPLEEQPGLVEMPEDDEGLPLTDSEMYAFKPAADLVITGAKAHAPGGMAVQRLEAGVEVAGRRVRLAVCGPRKVRVRDGQIWFSEPEPFTEMEITYRNAYGGVDRGCQAKLYEQYIAPIKPFVNPEMEGEGPAAYERNPVGKGYVIEMSEGVDGLELPTVEDPDDLLTPRRLVTGDPFRWTLQPVPAGIGWFAHEWFPRVAFTRIYTYRARPDAPRPDDPPLREATLGWVAPDIFTPKPIDQGASDRFQCGASPALIFPQLPADAPIKLINMDPDYPEFELRLPGDVPGLLARPLTEAAQQLQPFLNTVVVDMEQRTVACVWSGRIRCRLPHGPEQLEKVEHQVRWSAP